MIMSSIKTVNPANNKLIKEYQEFSPEQVQSIITKADDAYKKWKNTPIDDRSALLLKIAAILRDRKDVDKGYPT